MIAAMPSRTSIATIRSTANAAATVRPFTKQGAGGDRGDDQAESARSHVRDDLTLQDRETDGTRDAPHEHMTDGGRGSLRLILVADRFLKDRTRNSEQRLAQHLNHDFKQELDG